nr:MliC family protein [uncultured Desulfobulbus sp.]
MKRLFRVAMVVVGCMSLLQASAAVATAAQPSFSCKKVQKGSVEALVCADEELAELDRTLAGVYVQAIAQVGEEQSASLTAEQRGWIKGRDACWKSADKRGCVQEQYTLRIAELQARYRLVPVTGPITYRCDDPEQSVFSVTFFASEPPTLIAERGVQSSLMFLAPSASGTRYAGRNESFWEHQGEAMITWGYDTPEMHCQSTVEGARP